MRSSEAWVYQIDPVRRVCLRRPRHGAGPVEYFELTVEGEGSAPSPQPEPRFWRVVARGVGVPVLVTALAVGAFLVLYPLYPAAKFQVQKRLGSFNQAAVASPAVSSSNRVIIPKIGVDTAILEGPSLAILNKHDGVWHQRGAITGDNFVLSGHRFKYLPPNTSTLYNLGQLAVGDAVMVDWLGQRYLYTVSQTERVSQTDTAILAPSSTSELTIYTCYDKRQTERIVVIARPAT